jgi:hypothetical protein
MNVRYRSNSGQGLFFADVGFDTARFGQFLSRHIFELDTHLRVATLSGFGGQRLISCGSLLKFGCPMDRLSLLIRFVDHCCALPIDAHKPLLTLYARTFVRFRGQTRHCVDFLSHC